MKITFEIPDKLTPEIEGAVEQMKTETAVDKINAVCFWLIKQLHDTNATVMTLKQEGVHRLGEPMGSYQLTVEKI